MTKIGSIFVEVAGDITQYQKDIRSLRADAKESGTAISNALNNSISSNQAAKGITALSANLTTLANVAKTPAASFKTTSESIAANLGDLAKKAGLTEKQFAALNEKMLKTSATQNAERSLKQLASSAGLSAGEAKKLAMQMGFSSAEADKMTKSMRDAEGATDRLTKVKTGLKVAAAAAGVALVAVGGALAVSVKEAMAAEQAEAALDAVIKSTGGTAGYTTEALIEMAGGLQRVTTFSDDTITAGMAILATFKNVRGEGFERATEAALDMATVMKTDLNSAMLQIGKALNDPIKGLTSLSKAGVQFTEEQKEQIKTLVESGRGMEAQGIILAELESQFGGAAKAAGDTFGGKLIQLQGAFNNLQESVGFTITKNAAFTDGLDQAEDGLVKIGQWVDEHRDSIGEVFAFALRQTENWAIGLGVIYDWLGDVAGKMVEIGIIDKSDAAIKREKIKAMQEEIAVFKKYANDEKLFGEARIYNAKLAANKEKELAALIGETKKETGNAEVAVKSFYDSIYTNAPPAAKEVKDGWDTFAEGQEVLKRVEKDVRLFYDSIYENAPKAEEKIKDGWDEFEDGMRILKNVERDVDLFYGSIYEDSDKTSEKVKSDTEKTTEYMSERWNEAYDGMQDTLAEWIKTGEISFDSLLDMFKNMLAEMVAAWIMNTGRMVLGNILGGSGGWIGALGSIIGGGSGGSGGGGGFGGGLGSLGTLYSGYQYLTGGSGLLATELSGVTVGGAVGGGGGAVAGGGAAGGAAAGGAAAAEAGGAGGGAAAGSMGWTGPAAVAVIGAMLWAKFQMRPDVPPLAELLNSQGIGPDYFADVVGESFKAAVNPITGGTQAMMMDAESAILTVSKTLGLGIRATGDEINDVTLQVFDAARGGWVDLGKEIMSFGIIADNMGAETAAAMIEARSGVVGLAEELLDISKAQETSLDRAIDSMEDMGIEGSALKSVLGKVGDVMSGVTKDTSDLRAELYDLGFAADQTDDIISQLGLDVFDMTGDLGGATSALRSFAETAGTLDYGLYDLEQAIGDVHVAVRTAADGMTTIAQDTVSDINNVLDGLNTRSASSSLQPQVNVAVYVTGNDIIDTKRLDARVAVIADRLRVAAARRPNVATRRVIM